MAGSSSLLVSFLKTLPMMLLYGIVGPIFLLAYFGLDEPGTEWLFVWGSVITVLDVLIAVVVAWSGQRVRVRKTVDWKVVTTQFHGQLAPEVSPVSSAVPAPPASSAAERLAELDELMRKDLLTTEEYDAERKRILGGL